jgi:SAM-dependent methyltransferase
MSSKEEYEFEIGEEGLQYDILDTHYNNTTQSFILNAGIKPGMTVLDVGCGAGVMTAWLAKQVGPMGQVFAVDNSEAQLNVTLQRIKKEGLDNVKTEVLSAYEITKLNTEFDLIYCRFLLHHLHSPRRAIQTYFDNLRDGGLYIGEEGIMNMAFSYPPTFAWEGYEMEKTSPSEEKEGDDRDGDIGAKLFYECQTAGFSINDCRLVQPLLFQKKQKEMLLEGLKAYKKTDIEQGMTEEQWQQKYDETLRLIDDPKQLIAFYGSCQIAAQK